MASVQLFAHSNFLQHPTHLAISLGTSSGTAVGPVAPPNERLPPSASFEGKDLVHHLWAEQRLLILLHVHHSHHLIIHSTVLSRYLDHLGAREEQGQRSRTISTLQTYVRVDSCFD